MMQYETICEQIVPCDYCKKAKSIYVGVNGKPVKAYFCPFCGRPVDRRSYDVLKEVE